MGIDTISTGAWVSFLAECYEKGLVSKKDTEGLEIKWGSVYEAVKGTKANASVLFVPLDLPEMVF
jgi:aldehyde:ferredoxin oxidoreductase